MINYFDKFPRINYPYTDVNGNKHIIANTPDMSIRFKIVERIMQSPTAYYDYYWQDHDRVDIVADKYYGDVNLAWLVLLSAEAFDWIYDLPMNEDTFERYLQTKYKVNDVNILRTKLHHYEDISGKVIDNSIFSLLNEFNTSEVSIYEFEEKINEKKRNIKLVSKVYVKDILNEFDIRIQDIKNNRKLFNK